MLQRLVRSTVNTAPRPNLNVRRSVTMDVLVFGGAEVAAKEERLDAFEKRRIGRHHVFKLAVLRTSLAHQHLSVVFDDLRLDLTRMLVHQCLERNFAANDRVTNFFYTGGTKAVGLAWKTEWWSGALVRLEQWTGGPVGPNCFAFGQPLVN